MNIIKKLSVCVSLMLALVITSPLMAAELPILKTGFIFTTHHTPFLVACSKAEEHKNLGVWLKTLKERESYELMIGDKPVAILDLVVTKSGSEAAVLFAQKHLDVSLASITAIMAGIDKGTPMKIICPLQTEGIGLIAPKSSKFDNLQTFLDYIKTSKEPVKVGFHSPTSAPKIIFEGAMEKLGFKVTLDPSVQDAQILLVDLKDTSNLLAALSAKQVDAVVGPSPFPEVAITKGVGQLVTELRDLPPAGYWNNFPCCVAVASDAAIKEYPEVIEAFVKLIVKNNEWSNANQAQAGEIAAKWIGLPAKAGRMSSLVFLSNFNESWERGVNSYLSILNSLNKYSGSLKDKNFKEVKNILIDDSIINKVVKK